MKTIKEKLSTVLGTPILRCRKGYGSMRDFIYIRISPPLELSGDWNTMHNQVRNWIQSKLGFVPFYIGKEIGNDFGINLSIEKVSSIL